MYKFLFTVLLLLWPGARLFAQYPSASKPKPLPVRRVNGVVRDSLGRAIPAAAVRLLSPKDTLHVVTSANGVFNFPQVRSENFTIEVQMMSYHPYYKKYFLNDTKAILVLPPVMMISSLVQLKGVVVTTARGPQQRGDTTEFWAKDYIVRDYARLEDMLKRMEGFSTDANGMLSYHGKPVNRALFNGTKYFNGDVAAAIKELPADIVERIQIIQDNEAGTGARVSDADPSSQTLNIVTKADKSAGRMYQASVEGGTQERYLGGLSARAIDGVKQWSVMVFGMQEPLGIMGGGAPLGTISSMRVPMAVSTGGGGSGGLSKKGIAGLQFNNNIGRLKYDLGYIFTNSHSLSDMEDVSEEFYKEGSLKRSTKSTADNTTNTHALTLNANLTKGDFYMMAMVNFNASRIQNTNFRETRQTGILENLQQVASGSRSDAPSLMATSMLSFFQTRKVKLNVSIQSNSNARNGSGHDNTDTYGAEIAKPDSSLYLLQQQRTATSNHSMDASLRYEWKKKFTFTFRTSPIFSKSKDINYRDQATPGEEVKRLNDLSNDNILWSYKLPTGLTVTYKYNENFYVEGRGTYEVNWLHSRFHLKELDLSTRAAVFLPGLSAKYTIKNFGSVYALYSREVHLPTLLQLNTKPYYTTPFDVVIGNKDLSNGLLDTWHVDGSYMVPKVNINLTAAFNYNKTANDIGANRIVRVDTATNTIRTETHYLNIKGGDSKVIYYSLSKNAGAMNTTLKFGGRIEWGQQVYFADGNRELTDQRNNSYDLSAALTPLKWLDLTPMLSYRSNNNRNTLQPGRPLYNNEFNAQVTSAVFLPGELKINVSARQTILSASSLPVRQHPFVLDANIEKRFLKKKDAIVSLVVMDAFQQNNYNLITQTMTGYSNALSSVKSRYFLVQLMWSPQRFTRSKSATGVRRGDGSFVK